MALQPSKLILHNRAVSNCCARVRIAASLKNIPLKLVETSPKRIGRDPIYRELNPSLAVPILEAHYENGEPLIMTQTLSMLEFLEETYPRETRLIPPVSDMAVRSKVMDLALLVACDLQPSLNHRVITILEGLSSNETLRGPPRRGVSFTRKDEATQKHMSEVRRAYTTPVLKFAMHAYERIAKQSAGKFSVGDNVSIADICLVPIIQTMNNIRKSRVEKEYPTISRIMEACEEIDAFRLQGVPGKPRKHQKVSPSSQTDDVP